MLNYIKNKITEYKERKVKSKMAHEVNYAKFKRSDVEHGEIVNLAFNTGDDSIKLMYLYSQLDYDYWMRMKDLSITSIPTNQIGKIIK